MGRRDVKFPLPCGERDLFPYDAEPLSCLGNGVNHTPLAVVALMAMVLLIEPSYASEAADPLAEYTVLYWTENDGLPSSIISAIAQDSDGYLWLGTNEGVVRFDGTRFVRWNALSRTPLPERRVMSLLASPDGSLWVGFGGSGGVSRIRNLEVTNYDHADGIPEDFVISLTEDRNRIIWAASPSGLYRFGGERWERAGPEGGVPEGRISNIHEDKAGRLWIGTTAGIFRRNAGERTFQQVDAVNNFVNDFSEDPTGTIWTTDPLVGFRRVAQPSGNGRPFQHLRGNGIRLMHDRQGDLWVGTLGQGLWRVRNDRGTNSAAAIQVITADTGLSSNGVRSLFEDGEGNIWVGADGGLHRLSLASVTPVRNLGLVRAVVSSRDGTVWAGTANGLIRNPGADGERRELRTSNVSALHEDRNGTLWVATDRGLLRRAGGRFSPVPLPMNIRPQRIVAMTSDSLGNLWLCDQEVGVFRWNNGQLKAFSPSPELGRRTAYAVQADTRDRVWVALSGGMLAVIEPGEKRQVYGPRTGGSLRTIYEGRGNTIWLGGDDGLSRLSNGRFITASRKNGLPGNAVSAVLEDADGYLWAGVNSGIIRLSPREFDELADNPDYQVRYRIYDRSDGLAGLPLWQGAPTAVGGSEGRLWFVTGEGLTVVDTKKAKESRLKPRARIESVIVDDQRLSPIQGVDLPPLTRRLQIEYASPSSISASATKIRFRYRLEGFDPDWIEAGTRRQVSYTALPPRSYRFRVVANTSDGTWTEGGATWDFSITPAFYQARWFYGMCVMAVLLTLWVAWRLHLRRVQHQFSLVLAERTRVGRELHDTLLQSLVGVALQLEALSERVDEPSVSVKEYLRRMRMQVEDYVREARQSIWDLRSSKLERRDLVAALRQAGEHATTGAPIRFEFTVTGTPYQCPPRLEEQLLRIAREAIQNGVLHAKATFIRMHLQYEDQSVRLRVADDGRGFDPLQLGDLEGHYGLKSMQERAELAGGQLTIVSNRGKGTEIETVMPISSGAYRYVS